MRGTSAYLGYGSSSKRAGHLDGRSNIRGVANAVKAPPARNLPTTARPLAALPAESTGGWTGSGFGATCMMRVSWLGLGGSRDAAQDQALRVDAGSAGSAGPALCRAACGAPDTSAQRGLALKLPA